MDGNAVHTPHTSRRLSPPRARQGLRVAALWASGACIAAHAQLLPATGCPTFHCEPEALSLGTQPLINTVLTTVTSTGLGLLPAQGCSGDGTILACLFTNDQATGIARGTLKVLNATTLAPVWGSAGAAGSYNLNPTTSAGGEAPTVLANGTLAAGDGNYEVLYNSATGAMQSRVRLGSTKQNLGLTPLSPTYGVVSQEDATLTLINLTTWTKVQTLKLTDPETGGPVQLVSPSSGTGNVLYAIAHNSHDNDGWLYSVQLVGTQLQVSSAYEFVGVSGASPVVVTPAVSGLASNLVLIGVPGFLGDDPPQNRLVALLDAPGTGLATEWVLPLSAALTVSPTVDQGSQTIFYALGGPMLYQANVLTGASVASYNIKQIGGFPGPGANSFVVNSHIGGTQSNGVFTLLLAGKYTSNRGTGAQYVLTFQPAINPTTLLWSNQIANAPATYTAAWNFVSSSQPGIACPIAITDSNNASSIVRLCDF